MDFELQLIMSICIGISGDFDQTGTLGRSKGMVQGGRREGGLRWETRVYLCQINVDVWQNQYNIVKSLASN